MKDKFLGAMLQHVVFDGWSEAAFNAACEDVGISADEARALFPKGPLGVAAAFHERGDHDMLAALDVADLNAMRIREKVAFAVRSRIEVISHKDAVRRGVALFSLPHNAAVGAQLIWGTADAIWNALGDPSRDGNWYSKRAILSGVYSSVVLFWLGDDSEGNAATWAFLDRRIDDVMRIEEMKSNLRASPLTKGLMAGVDGLFGAIKAPNLTPRSDLPGRWDSKTR